MFYKSSVSVAVSILLGSIVTIPSFAQDSTQRVEITGSLVRRTQAETSLPVTVMKVDDLYKQGVTSTEQLLGRLVANQSSYGVSQAIGATTGAKAEADLRGLGAPTGDNANKTLVLLNGRRLANHPFDAAAVDLNAIPLAAIDRVEILRDGASALYGTDAIGGVINFILRRDYNGLEVSAQAIEPTTSGGGDTRRASLVGGFGSLSEKGFNVFGTLDYRKQSTLLAADRRFAATGVLGSGRAALTSGTSGTSFPGDLGGFEPSGPNCNPPSSLPRFTTPDNTGAFNSCRYDFTHDIDIIPSNEQWTGLLRGTFMLGQNHTLSAEYVYASNKATAHVAAAPTSSLMPATSPFFPAGAPVSGTPLITLGDGSTVGGAPGGVANWRQIPAGRRTSGDDSSTERALIDLQGVLGGFDYKFGLGRTQSKSTASVKGGYVNDDMIQRGVWDGVINPFGAQTAAGQAAIDAAQVNSETQVGKATIDFVDLRFSKDLMQLSAGPLAAAWGAEYRREKSSFTPNPITAVLGSLGIDPNSATSGSRNVSALFAEFNFPVTKTLDLTLAARYDRYSDFGNTFNPKASVRYQPVREVVLRGSYNKGFRAPTLYDIYRPQQLTFTSDNYDDPVLCPGGTAVPGVSAGVVCGQQVLRRLIGPVAAGRSLNDLQPEKSNAFSIGFVVEPNSSFNFSVDYWNYKIKNLITQVPEQEIFADPVKYAARFVRCSAVPAATRATIDACLNFPNFDPIAYIDQPTENLGESHTSGIDVSLNWRSAATPMGRWGLNIDGTWVKEFKYQHEIGGPYIDAVGRYADVAPVLRWKHTITGTWNYNAWSATLSQRYKSGYVDQGGARDVGSYTVYDASVSWSGIKDLSLTLGVNNLFNQDPPTTVQVTTFQRGYDPRLADPLGRAIMLRASYKFF